MSRLNDVCFGALVKIAATAGVLAAGGNAAAITYELPFYEYFEPSPDHWDWQAEWQACDTCGGDPYCPDDPMLPMCDPPEECSARYGPLKFESWPDLTHGGTVFSGQRSGRQPIWDPYWGAILHPFDPPTEVADLRLKVWQHDFADILCDCDPWGPPSRPNFDVHGWLVLTNPYRTEYYVLGVNSKKSWTHLVWATKTDGWNTTSLARVTGWRKMEILVHPYAGVVGDVEFLVDDVVVAQGRRDPGTGNGVDVEWLRLGGDPALITESHLTNTFEEFWYDEVALTVEPPTRSPCINPELLFDTDNDGDVDQQDFGLFQSCYTGPDDPLGVFDMPTCRCMDADWDFDVDEDDYDVFEGCASGPGMAADPDCDEPPPP